MEAHRRDQSKRGKVVVKASAESVEMLSSAISIITSTLQKGGNGCSITLRKGFSSGMPSCLGHLELHGHC